MNIYTVSLFGHRSLLNPLSAESNLERAVYQILKNHGYVNLMKSKSANVPQVLITNPLFRLVIKIWLTVPI